MKVILDTNVLVSGIFFGGVPYKILELWYTNKFDLIVSEEIFSEYVLVLRRLHDQYPLIDIKEIIKLIADNAHFHKQTEITDPVSRDPDDDKFIKCALESGTKIIVSGDKDLLDLNGHMGIKVISPSDFIGTFQ